MLLLLSVSVSVVHSLHSPVCRSQRVRLQRAPGYNEQISLTEMLTWSVTMNNGQFLLQTQCLDFEGEMSTLTRLNEFFIMVLASYVIKEKLR